MIPAKAARPSGSKASFENLLSSNSEWITWIEETIKLEKLIKSRVNWDGLDKGSIEFIQKRFGSTTPQSQLLINSFYLTMAAGFEEYLRATLQDVIRGLTAKKPTYAQLTESIRDLHIRESAKLLKRLDSPPDYITFNKEDLCRGLGSCVPGSAAVILNPEALSDVDSLIKLKNFMDRMSNLGKKIDWDTLGTNSAIKSAMNLPGGKPRAVGKSLENELAIMARYRNRIAHTGGNASDVTPEILASHRNILKAAVAAIDAIV